MLLYSCCLLTKSDFDFNCFRLEQYNLSDANDDLANYLILSLQNDMIVPNIAVIYYFVKGRGPSR